jgi:phosphatidylinositol alpha-mannosyltransferase
VIPNGVDVDRFAARVQPLEEFSDGKTNILFVGRPEKRKGLDYLLRAFRAVKANRPDTRLIVVGAGKFQRYEQAVKSMRLRDVVFRSHVDADELSRYHHSSHIFCAPATGFESQGIVLLEAMAAGLPIVASNIVGYASVLTHGEEGLLALPQDSEGLADALTTLIDDPALRDKMARKGKRRAQSYSWARVSQQVLSYYERLLHERALTSAASKARSKEAG